MDEGIKWGEKGLALCHFLLIGRYRYSFQVQSPGLLCLLPPCECYLLVALQGFWGYIGDAIRTQSDSLFLSFTDMQGRSVPLSICFPCAEIRGIPPRSRRVSLHPSYAPSACLKLSSFSFCHWPGFWEEVGKG